MFVRDYYLPKEKLVVLDIKLSLEKALKIITDGRFLSLPVVDGDEFKGFLSKESIFRHFFDLECDDRVHYLQSMTVSDIYRRDIAFIDYDDTIEKASFLLLELGTPFLAVYKHDNFAGILTHTAIFEAFKFVNGNENDAKVIVRIDNKPGEIAKLTDIIYNKNVNIENLLAIAIDDSRVMQVSIKLDVGDIVSIKDELINKGYTVVIE